MSSERRLLQANLCCSLFLRTLVKIFLIIISLAVAGLVGYSYYLWSKLAPIMNDPRATAQLVSWPPKPFDGPTREINLGYARVRIPATFTAEAWQYSDTLVVILGDNESDQTITFMPPVLESEESASLLSSFQELTGERLTSIFDFQKRALLTQPSTFWQVMTQAPTKTVTAATLLLAKHSLVSPPDAHMYQYENDRVGIIIRVGAKFTSLTVHDKRAGSMQGMMFKTGLIELDPLVTAVASSYQFTADGATEEQMLTNLRATGIRSQGDPPAKSMAANPDQPSDPEKLRLKQIAEEIRKRRDQRQQFAPK